MCLTGVENSFIKQPTSIDSSIMTLHCVNSFFCTNTGQCGPKKIPYLATFHAVSLQIGDYSYLKVQGNIAHFFTGPNAITSFKRK